MSNGCEQLHWNLHSHTTRSARAFNAIARRPYAAFNNCAYAPLHFKEAAFQVEDNFTQHHHTLDTTTAVATATTTIAIHNKTDSTICFCMLCICVCVWGSELHIHRYHNYAVSVLSIAFCSHFNCSAVATWSFCQASSAGGTRSSQHAFVLFWLCVQVARGRLI